MAKKKQSSRKRTKVEQDVYQYMFQRFLSGELDLEISGPDMTHFSFVGDRVVDDAWTETWDTWREHKGTYNRWFEIIRVAYDDCKDAPLIQALS